MVIYKKSFFLFLSFVIFYPTQSFSEYVSNINDKNLTMDKKITVKEFQIEKALSFFDQLLTKPLRLTKSKEFLFRIENIYSINDTDDLKKFTDAKKRALRSDYGIKFRAGVRESTGNLNLYNNSAFAGISLDIVKDGFLENRLKSEEVTIEQSLAENKTNLSKRKLLSLYRQNFVSYYFANLKIPILRKRLKILSELMRVKREGYFYGIELTDSLVKIEREIEKANAELRQYKELTYTYCKIEKYNFCNYTTDRLPPVLSVKLQRIIRELMHSEILKEDRNLKKGSELIKLKHDWRHNMKLGAYLYFNTKGDDSFFTKKGFVGGLNLSYPLSGNYENVDRIKLMQNIHDLEKRRDDLINYINLLFRDEEEKVSDAVKTWYGMDIAFERIRRESYKLKRELKKGTVLYRDYVALLENVKNYMDSEFEFVSSEDLLYRRIVNLLTTAGVKWKNMSREIKLTPLGNRFRAGNRYVILKKRELDHLSIDFIVDLLYTKGIKYIVMGKSLYENRKGKELLKTLSSAGIKSYLLVAEEQKIKNMPLCLSVKSLSSIVGDWQCIIYDGKIDKVTLKKLLNSTDIFFIPQKYAVMEPDKIGIIVHLKPIRSELEFEKKLDKLYKSGIKNFLFDFTELMKLYTGASR
ncbi:hypothetical protein [Nitratifractor sp.]